jgi:hypothetical protein
METELTLEHQLRLRHVTDAVDVMSVDALKVMVIQLSITNMKKDELFLKMFKQEAGVVMGSWKL